MKEGKEIKSRRRKGGGAEIVRLGHGIPRVDFFALKLEHDLALRAPFPAHSPHYNVTGSHEVTKEIQEKN